MIAGITLGLVIGLLVAHVMLAWKTERLAQQVQALKEAQQ